MNRLINNLTLTDQDFDQVRAMAYDACGLSLHLGKRALVSSRLERLVRRNGFASFTNYLAFLSQRRTGEEFIEFIDTLTTNHSGFWREPEHFLFLRDIIMPRHRARLRVWSAACATGEEPYTIAMCALDAGVNGCSIAATDVSRAALRTAIEGRYEASKVSPLPAGWTERYFQENASRLRVADTARRLVNFSALNLLRPFTHMGIFDVIFCRNVMIYFDRETRDKLVEDLAAQLAPGGYLFTGHSETLLRLPPALKYVRPATYRRI
ncbi:MAG TPA: protein-glutamate O-methyltransferase CheR [Bryobacteraceae bacterium]|nr:protein-glutamate O-methyltransferase CheR [Bryobacteraceae bacterium]